MATWADVAEVALSLPETSQHESRDGVRAWRVRGDVFVWERPLRKADLAELGEQAPADPPLAAYVPDLGAKEALLADEPDVYFTTSHFRDHRSVLARLELLSSADLVALLTEAWLSRAPKRLAKAYLASQAPHDPGDA